MDIEQAKLAADLARLLDQITQLNHRGVQTTSGQNPIIGLLRSELIEAARHLVRTLED